MQLFYWLQFRKNRPIIESHDASNDTLISYQTPQQIAENRLFRVEKLLAEL